MIVSNKTTIVILLSILLLGSLNAQSTGFQVQSVSMTKVLHPGQQQNASQVQWLINVVANGGGQSLQFGGAIPNTTLGQACNSCQGDSPSSTLTISGTENPEVETYPIEQSLTTLTQYDYYAEEGYINVNQGLISTTYNATSAYYCPPTDPNISGYNYNNEWDYEIPTSVGGVFGYYANTSYSPTVIRICIYSKQQGTINQFDTNPYVKFSTALTFSNSNGQTESLSVSNANQSGTAQTPQGDIQVNWPGSLVTGNPTTYSQGEVAVDNYQSQTWSIASTTQYSTYSTDSGRALNLLNPYNEQFTVYKNNTLTNLQCTGLAMTLSPSQYNYSSVALKALTNCMIAKAQSDYNTNNNDVQNLLNGGSSLGGYSAQLNSGSQPSFSISIPNYFTSNPELDLRVSGTFLGVIIPLGKPKILSVSSTPFRSGGNGTITATVENIGSGLGSFYYALSNCNGITTPSSAKYTLSPNSTQTITIPILATSPNQTISESCTIGFTDNNGGGSDTASVSVSVSPPNQCTPNSQVVQGSSICSCIEINGVWKVGTACTICQNGVLTNGTSYYCESPPQTSTNKYNNSIQQSNVTPSSPSYNQTLTHSDVLIVTISSKLNEDFNYRNTLVNYENVLSSEGLSYKYVELDSYNPNMNIDDWHSVKTTLNRLEYFTTPTYVVILGDVNIVPMPTVYNLVGAFDWGNGTSSHTIPTDDFYGSLTNSSIPSIVVARIPGTTADEIANFLSNAIKRHSNPNNNFIAVSDGVNSFYDAFLRNDTNRFLSFSNENCGSFGVTCVYSPQYCSNPKCTLPTTFRTDISSDYGIQWYACHGDGYTCTNYYDTYPILSAGIDNVSYLPAPIPTLYTNPIILTEGCHNGIINTSSGKTLALQMMDDGAAAYVGNTKFGVSPYSNIDLGYLYSQMHSGKTLGQAFLAMKIKYLTNPYDDINEGATQELQLYGDPTLSING